MDRGPDEMRTLRGCVERRELAAYSTTVHALKSAGLAVGGTRFSALAREAEQLARAGDEAAYGLLDRIDTSLRELCAALMAHPLLRAQVADLSATDEAHPAVESPALTTGTRG